MQERCILHILSSEDEASFARPKSHKYGENIVIVSFLYKNSGN